MLGCGHDPCELKQDCEICEAERKGMKEQETAFHEAAAARTTEGARDSSTKAYLRERFVTALVDWLQMHDYHAPFPRGPPRKDQPCGKVENEHTDQERTFCGKLFPRKLIAPGSEEVSEDPRRRELYRVWLARNCSFVNNYAPVMLLAGLGNMDMQATLTKTGVIDYMTKYMTKTGMGSLIGLMERSFTACLDKARDDGKGAGSAMLRWFNLTSMAEVKSQLETMHLCFQLPRYLCSRDFNRLAVKSEYKKLKDIADVKPGMGPGEKLTQRGAAQVYLERGDLKYPLMLHLTERHPTTGQTLQSFIEERVGEKLDQNLSRPEKDRTWKLCVQSLSWWEFKRLFQQVRGYPGQIRFKEFADILIVAPAPRLAQGVKDDSWYESCRMALLTYRNHGPGVLGCEMWNLVYLQALSVDTVEEHLKEFVEADSLKRKTVGMCPCPPFLRRSWLLGRLRQLNHKKARRTAAEVIRGKPRSAPPLVSRHWAAMAWQSMTPEMRAEAKAARETANREEHQRELEEIEGSQGCSEAATAARDARVRMRKCLYDLGWTKAGILHDALFYMSETAPGSPSDLCYFWRLHTQLNSAASCYLPQNKVSHRKEKLRDVLRALTAGGTRLGGWTGKKEVLAQRLAKWMDHVVQAGRDTDEADALRGAEDEEVGDGEPSQKRCCRRQEWDPQGLSWREEQFQSVM